MNRRLELLRLDYMFAVIVPCLMAIYYGNLNFWQHIDIVAGFGFYAIAGNTLNDILDARNPSETETIERIKGFRVKEIATLSIISFFIGTMLFIRTIKEHWINGVILAVIIAMVGFYCLKKIYPIINQIFLGASHVILPYLIIKIDADAKPLLSPGEWCLVITFFSFAVTAQIVHEIIDGDAIIKYPPRLQQLIVLTGSSFTIAMGIITIVVLKDIYFLPLIIVPIGMIYAFRKPTRSTKGVKDVGIIVGNLMMVYFLILILRNIFFISLI